MKTKRDKLSLLHLYNTKGLLINFTISHKGPIYLEFPICCMLLIKLIKGKRINQPKYQGSLQMTHIQNKCRFSYN